MLHIHTHTHVYALDDNQINILCVHPYIKHGTCCFCCYVITTIAFITL